ncbi:MAG: hypothetical protein ACKO2N_16610 [Tabrizicola sp.]
MKRAILGLILTALLAITETEEEDFGGYRLQALAVLGNASTPDRVCRRTLGRARLEADRGQSVHDG